MTDYPQSSYAGFRCTSMVSGHMEERDVLKNTMTSSERLQNAIDAHKTLQKQLCNTSLVTQHQIYSSNDIANQFEKDCNYTEAHEVENIFNSPIKPHSNKSLTDQLLKLYKRYQKYSTPRNNTSKIPTKFNNTMKQFTEDHIQDIKYDDKDKIIYELLERSILYKMQRNEAIAYGEKLATQLLQQQRDLLNRHRQEITILENKLKHATQFLPDVSCTEIHVPEDGTYFHEQRRKRKPIKLNVTVGL